MSETQRTRQKAATRQALKASASTCFARAGFEKTSITAITGHCGVATGTFYVHFPSKEALLAELLADFNAGLLDELTPIWRDAELDAEASVVGHIHRTAEAVMAYFRSNRGFVETYGRAFAPGLMELASGINPPAEQFLTVQLSARFPHLSPTAVALTVHALLVTWVRIALQVLFQPDIDESAAIETLTRLTLGMVAGIDRGGIDDSEPVE